MKQRYEWPESRSFAADTMRDNLYRVMFRPTTVVPDINVDAGGR